MSVGIRRCDAEEGAERGRRVQASDRSAGAMWYVGRCKAEQDDGLINPATPPVQWEEEGCSR